MKCIFCGVIIVSRWGIIWPSLVRKLTSVDFSYLSRCKTAEWLLRKSEWVNFDPVYLVFVAFFKSDVGSKVPPDSYFCVNGQKQYFCCVMNCTVLRSQMHPDRHPFKLIFLWNPIILFIFNRKCQDYVYVQVYHWCYHAASCTATLPENVKL